MKKLMTLMLGLGLVLGATAFAQDTSTNPPKPGAPSPVKPAALKSTLSCSASTSPPNFPDAVWVGF